MVSGSVSLEMLARRKPAIVIYYLDWIIALFVRLMIQCKYASLPNLIADRDYGVEDVQKTVQEWFDTLNPEGFSGAVCTTGGCNRAMRDDGCGGMRALHVNV